MQNWKLGSAVAVLAATVLAGTAVTASAQDMMMRKKTHGYAARTSRPLTVTAPVARPAVNPLTAPSTLR